MFPRRTIVRSGGKEYPYVHLVQSVRRKSDGRVVHKVIANLGVMDDLGFENLRRAFEATREGKRVAVISLGSEGNLGRKPTANLRYLDVAVASELWREWGLDQVFEGMGCVGKDEVRWWKVVKCLVIQRLVDPDSKLAAVRWFPGTALPEMEGISLGQFNNTRIHRVLDELEGRIASLMGRLPGVYEDKKGAFATLFLDVTDTWFEGRGCEMAERGKTKEGMIRKKVGIVLLCNEKGFPVRWDVVRGNMSDSEAMKGMLDRIKGFQWALDVPLVMDRAMGDSEHIRWMAQSGLKFLVALKRTEYESYAWGLPDQAMEGLCVEGREEEEVLREAGQRAEAVGLKRVNDKTYVIDFGVVEPKVAENLDSSDDGAEDFAEDGNAMALQIAKKAEQGLADRRYPTVAVAAAALGVKRSTLLKYMKLLALDEEIATFVLQGRIIGWPLSRLISLAQIPEKVKQRERFRSLLTSSEDPRKFPRGAKIRPKNSQESPKTEKLRVRVVGYFNPEMYLEQRQEGRKRLEEMQMFVQRLNRRLASPRSRSNLHNILAELDTRLHRDNVVGLYNVRVESRESGKGTCPQIVLELNEQEWKRRHRFDGFSVLVGAKGLPHTGETLCWFYRSKDQVEKDFGTIKSVAEIRPIRHHTDLKVRAHVALCMLALLLERTLHDRLARLGLSAERALDELETCHLNLYQINNAKPIYTITHTNQRQTSILRALRMTHLADDAWLQQNINPRLPRF